MEYPKSWIRSHLEACASGFAKKLGYKMIPVIHAEEPPTVVCEHETYYIYRNKARFEVLEGYPKYFLLERQDRTIAILCNACLMISYSPGDIKHRYCHKCNSFHHNTGSDQKKAKYLAMDEVLQYETLSRSWIKALFFSRFKLLWFKIVDRKYKRYLFHPKRGNKKGVRADPP